MNTIPTDFLGREIEEGDVIAIAMGRRRSSATLQRRYVREVRPDHLVVQPTSEDPDDRRTIARVTNFRNCIIIS